MRAKARGFFIWLGIIVAWAVLFWAKDAFNISNDTIIKWLPFILIAGMWWSLANRVGKLEERTLHNDYAGIIKEIELGDRHKPQHQQPMSLKDGGGFGFGKYDEIVFEDFRWFGSLLNYEVADVWSIEELNSTDLRGFYDGPRAGRRYQVYCRAFKMGTIQVHNMGLRETKARAEIELRCLRFVPYRDAHSLIRTIALFMGKFNDDPNLARDNAYNLATAALTKHLWESVRDPTYDVDFSFSADGPYEYLRMLTSDLKERGIDPIKEWGGDRPPWDEDNLSLI